MQRISYDVFFKWCCALLFQLLFKRLGSVIYLYIHLFLKVINIFISDIKNIYNAEKIFISNKCCFELSSHQRIQNKCIIFPKNIKQQFSIIIINVSWSANHHIRMISEGSCDTEDWRNDAENSALHARNKFHYKIYSHRKVILNFNNISLYVHLYVSTVLLIK